MRDAVNRFATEHPADSALGTNTDTTPSLALGLRHVLALRLARPFTYVAFPGDASTQPLMRERMPFIQLKGKHVAHLSGSVECDPIIVRDLVSGDHAGFRGQAREKVMGFALSTEIVAFVTYTGTMYVASLADLTASPSPVRLPSSSVLDMAASGGTVACLLGGSCDPLVVIYKAGTRKSNSFTLETMQSLAQQEDFQFSPNVCTISVNEDRETVDVAAISFPSDGNESSESVLRVMVSRYTLAGDHIAQTAWDQQIFGLRDKTASLGPLQGTGERGILSMEVNYYHDDLLSSNNERTTDIPTPLITGLTLLYDEDMMGLKAIDWTVFRCTEPSFTHIPRPTLWKNRLYRTIPQADETPTFSAAFRSETRGPQDGPHVLEQLNEQCLRSDQGNVNSRMDHGYSRLWPQSVQRRPRIELEGCHDFLVMNDSFAVTVRANRGPAGIQVACFDERVEMHGAESTGLWEDGAKSRTLCWNNNVPYTLPSTKMRVSLSGQTAPVN